MKTLPASVLRELGISSGQLTSPDLFHATPRDGQRGLAAPAPRRLETRDLERRDSWRERRSERASWVGLELSWDLLDPRLLMLVDVDGGVPDIKAVGQESSGSAIASSQSSTWFVDLSQADAFRVTTARGSVVIRGGGEELVLWGLVSDLPAVEPLASIDAPPLEAWISELGEDEWLSGAVADYARRCTSWATACAVGLFGRLRQVDRSVARAAVEALLAGRGDPVADRPWRWAHELTAAQVDTLWDLAILNTERLRDLADEILGSLDDGESPDVMSPTVEQTYRELTLQRDDVECVLRLLRETSAPAPDAIVEELDADGLALSLSLPRWDWRQEDERLRRVSKIDPNAWWARR